MSDQPNTQPLNPKAIQDILGESDAEVAAAKKRLPDASLLRAALVGVLLFAGAAIGKPELGHEAWVDALVSGYVVVSPLALAWFLRRTHKTLQAATLVDSSPPGKHEKP